LILLGVALAAITGVVMVQPLLPTGRVMLEEGDITSEHIRAPRRVSYESEILYEEAQEQAAANVDPIYKSPDPTLAHQQLDRARVVLDYIGAVRADSLNPTPRKRGWILAVPELSELSTETTDRLFSLSDESWDRVQLETLDIVEEAMRQEIREGNIDIARERIPRLVGLDLSSEEAAVTSALAQSFLRPNTFLDPEATVEAKARARGEVPSTLRTFEAGQIIVREGERVEAIDIEALDQLGLRKPQASWADFIGAGLLSILEVVLLYLYMARFQSESLWNGQHLLLLVLLIIFFVLEAGLMIPEGKVLRYLAPASALAMLTTGALGPHAGVASTIFLSGVTGVIADNSLKMTLYTAMGGFIAALALRRVERIGELFRAGAFVALTHIVVLAVFDLPQVIVQPTELLSITLAGIASGGLAASLTLGGLFLIAPLFDIITTMRLIELSRPESPLLQLLLREAPATYHHSLMVANLAEQAAEAIGANALLTRVGAYYHDIGKMTRPYFFTENQADGMNPHDRLDPQTSAGVIVGHVTDGIELARRYRLPKRVRAFIPEHHGSNQVSFLYHKAVQLAGGPNLVEESDFRYPGRKPQSKETALVMLADGCEAAVRSAAPRNAEDVAKIVNNIIDQRVNDGQLNECDLTMQDLAIIRQTFTSALKGTFHPRIKYPEPKKDAQEEKQTAGSKENV
jgi:putative nucleotidyltransferase with HDIG domain